MKDQHPCNDLQGPCHPSPALSLWFYLLLLSSIYNFSSHTGHSAPQTSRLLPSWGSSSFNCLELFPHKRPVTNAPSPLRLWWNLFFSVRLTYLSSSHYWYPLCCITFHLEACNLLIYCIINLHTMQLLIMRSPHRMSAPQNQGPVSVLFTSTCQAPSAKCRP